MREGTVLIGGGVGCPSLLTLAAFRPRGVHFRARADRLHNRGRWLERNGGFKGWAADWASPFEDG